MKSARRKY